MRVVERALAGRHGKRQRRHILRCCLDQVLRAVEFGLDLCSLPVLFQTIHGHPQHLIVTQRPRRELHFVRHGIAPLRCDAVDAPVDLLFRAAFVGVRRLWSDDVRQFDSFGLQRFGHHVGSLLLSVDFAAVRHGRAVEQIRGVVCAVVEVPEFLLIPTRLDGFILKNL